MERQIEQGQIRAHIPLFICNHAMRKIESTQAGGNLTDDVFAWRKYFLLPTILFDNAGRERRIKDYRRGRIELLVRDDWSQFTLGSLKLSR